MTTDSTAATRNNHRSRFFSRACTAVLVVALALFSGIGNLAAGQVNEKPLTLVTSSFRPNILLIADSSESMQEGVDGRVALDWDNPECVPGPGMDPDECPAGARSPLSKGSIVKDVGLNLIDQYEGLVSLGLLSYQQNPASRNRNDFNSGGTVRWHLVERAIDVRFSTDANPDWYQPDHTEPWDSNIKRYRTPHPTRDGIYMFFNDAVPGYSWNSTPNTGVPDLSVNATLFLCRTDVPTSWTNQTWDCHYNPDFEHDPEFTYNTMFEDLRSGSGAVQDDIPGIGSGLWFADRLRRSQTFLVDSQRQRAIDSWGRRSVWSQLNQLEWRTTTSPGKGYLHQPIKPLDAAHAEAIRKKLQPQRVDWNPDAMTDPEWPLIAAGLTPLEGTMQTARDYFLGAGSSSSGTFGPDQGWSSDLPELPTSCGINASIWVTDGLPSVSASGVALGHDLPLALEQARQAVEDFYTATEAALGDPVPTYIVGFALPAGVENIEGMPASPLDLLANAGGTDEAVMADDAAALQQVMSDLFQQIVSDSLADFGAVSSGAVAIEGALGFKTISNPDGWVGDLIGLRNPNLPNEEERWKASEEMPEPADRNLLTAGRAFTEIDFENDDAFDELFFDDDLEGYENEAIARNLIRYVRGGYQAVDLVEVEHLGFSPFQRNSLIGVIAGSNTVLQRVRNFGWSQLPEDEGGGSVYNEFLEEKEDLDEIVYVGSNLGVLHAFDLGSGEEVFGYVPRGVYPNLFKMATQDFQYTVDGQIRLFDAYDGNDWHQILVGTLGAGGKTIYALDVTDPSAPEFLWEVGPEDLDHVDHMGLTFSSAQPARLADGDWVVVAGNGYHSESGHARLLVIDLFGGGDVLHDVEVDDSGSNGLSSPRVAQDVMDRIGWSRWVYAGDLDGNLWRIELGESKSDTPEVKRLFDGDRPITMQPQTIYPRRGNGYVVTFGTGKYFEEGDDSVTDAPTEYFYVIQDAGPGVTNVKRSDSGMIDRTAALSDSATGEIDLYDDGTRGWYVRLDHGGRTGARALFTPDERIGRILFTTFRPDEDECSVGGVNEVYMMSLRGGSGAFPDGDGDYTAQVGEPVDGAPVPAFFLTRPVVDDETGETLARTGISVGSRPVIDIEGDPEFDDIARVRAFGERLNWRQNH